MSTGTAQRRCTEYVALKTDNYNLDTQCCALLACASQVRTIVDIPGIHAGKIQAVLGKGKGFLINLSPVKSGS